MLLCISFLTILFIGCISDKDSSDDNEMSNDDELSNEEELSIEYFVVKPGLITIGHSANLTWKVTGATNVSIDNNIGKVGFEGWYIIFPKFETKYTLTASNSTDELNASTTIYIIEDNIDITPNLIMTKEINNNICILTIISINDDDVLWSNTAYTFLDWTSGKEITSGITYPSSGFISIGDVIKITGLTELNTYRFDITYIPTGEQMGFISWIQ
jgi:hypothetical protein